jgi:ubiquinone/menaquinone biosynthesis C-methylase UbiE
MLMVDVYHELRWPQQVLRSLRRSLKLDGRLVVIEYRQEDARLPIAATHRMSVRGLRAEIEPERFAFDRLISGLPRQHVVVFRKKDS